MIQSLRQFDQRHPYVTSAILASVLMLFSLFYTRSLHIIEDYQPPVTLDIIDINTLQAPKRVVKKEITTDPSDTSNPTQVDRAQGTNEDSKAVDLAFYPNIAPPKPIGKLKRIYPKEARQQGIEATLFIAMLIDKDGFVRQVNVLGSRLSKNLPPEASVRITRAFAAAAVEILTQARFSPTIYNGRKVPIRMEMPLKFRLDL